MPRPDPHRELTAVIDWTVKAAAKHIALSQAHGEEVSPEYGSDFRRSYLAFFDIKKQRALGIEELAIKVVAQVWRSVVAEFHGDSIHRYRKKASAVCSYCKDTHQMDLTSDGGDTRKVMCTRCPTPCSRCRQNGNGVARSLQRFSVGRVQTL